ncbi:Quinol monooxygenase YgiN [Agreia bicolorata]|uniref:Antibiotic biosynthesis monooxygenase n=1 Tax=Agreia bicolorata TaxID=110935 RepID=A0A1T4YD47_9MICO|nr:antibiotic biosynthesis monooxygenase [Agreia bicolorata]KJC65710.1 antibiotic biosynthesis monooxygenase [Agreia bicolorata]SKA99630.1 Quinol monooxygenase YgiN [Agreia bicolorata]
MSAVPPTPTVLYAEFTALPGCEEAVAELLAALADDVRREPGCVEFAPYRVSAEPSRFFVYEVYRDGDAFAAHIEAPYGRAFNERLVPLIVEDGSQLTWLQPLSS